MRPNKQLKEVCDLFVNYLLVIKGVPQNLLAACGSDSKGTRKQR